MKINFLSIMLALIVFAPTSGSAQIDRTMNYQGLLTDSSGNPVNGSKNFRFWIFDAFSGGTFLWSESQLGVPVNNGVFNVILGSIWPMNLDMRSNLFLEVQVDHTGSGSWEIMSPRHALVATPYALAAGNVVYRQVLTVTHAEDEGVQPRSSYTTISRAIDRLLGRGVFATQGALSPAPSAGNPWVIEVKAGTYFEPGTQGGSGRIVIPDHVTIRGQGWDATKIRTAGITMTGGTSRSLENLYIWGTNASSNVIAMTSASRCTIRNVKIESQQPNPSIDMSSAQYCEVLNNHIVGYGLGPGPARGIRVDNTQHCRIEDNYINLAHPSSVSNSSGSWGISNNNTSMAYTVISKNTIRYNTTGQAGTTASYGIGVSGTVAAGTGGIVSHNIFLYGTTNKDIVAVSTGAPPTWTAPGVGDHGIGNQRSNGTQAPAF